MSKAWPEGIYELLRTRGMDESLRLADAVEPTFAPVEPAVAADVLARHIAAAVSRAVAEEADEGRRIALVNRLLRDLRLPDDELRERAENLTSIRRQTHPPRPPFIRPVTPLASAALLTN